MRRFVKIVLPLCVVFVLVRYNTSQQKVLEYYDAQIDELTQDVAEIDDDIQELYRSAGKQAPTPFYSLSGSWLKTQGELEQQHRTLLDKKWPVLSNLSNIYQQKAEYFAEERFFRDPDAPVRYKRDALSPEAFLTQLQAGDARAQDYANLLLETRREAFGYYTRAAELLDDYSSRVYVLQVPRYFTEPIPLRLDTPGGSLDLLVRDLIKDESFRQQYLSQRVRPSLHHQLGILAHQIANLSFQLHKEHQAILTLLDDAEKEYYIALGVDHQYVNAVYDLARLYLWRYEHCNEYKKEYLLGKIHALLHKYLVERSVKTQTLSDTLGKAIERPVLVSLSLSDEIGSWFVLARTYYHIAGLDVTAFKSLSAVYSHLLGEQTGDTQEAFIDRAIAIYQERLLYKTLKKGSESYANAERNVQVLQALKSIKQ